MQKEKDIIELLVYIRLVASRERKEMFGILSDGIY